MYIYKLLKQYSTNEKNRVDCKTKRTNYQIQNFKFFIT